VPVYERIYVRAPNWVGDLVMATTAFERLRGAFPDAHITGAMRPYLRELCDGSDWFDDVVAAPRVSGIRDLRQQVGAVRAGRFDLAVVLPNSFVTGLVPFLARVPERLGYRQARPGLMTKGLTAVSNRPFWRRYGPKRVPDPMPVYYALLLDLLEIPPGPDRPKLYVRPQDREACEVWLAEQGIRGDQRIVLITAGASFGASKLWVPERFAAVARHFRDRGDAPVLLAGPSELEPIVRIGELAGAGVTVAAPALPFGTLKALCERAALMITTDTGPRHLGVAFDVPIVCLIGPTDPRYTNYCLERQTLIRKLLPCVPCQRKVCPLGHHDCMRAIEVDEVLAAAEAWLPGLPR
jgi:heptosyltransferase-2